MSIWVHVTGHTYGSWLPGDDRTFRTRHHREHITSDTKRYANRRTRAQEAMRSAGRERVMLSVEARRVALDAMVDALQFKGAHVRIACLDSHHFHVLVRLPAQPTMKVPEGSGHRDCDPWASRPGDSSPGASKPTDPNRWVSSEMGNYLPEARALFGYAKRSSARALSEKGLVAPGGVWATRMHMTRIVDQDHSREAVAYIRAHATEARGAEIWESAPSNPPCFPAYPVVMTTTASPTATIGNPPLHPAGPNPGAFGETFTQAEINQCIEKLASAPKRLRDAVAGLTKAQLDTKYKNWTVRQIAVHLADSHANAYIRWKLALTEDVPTIKPYNEGAWSDLPGSRTADIAHALAFFEGVQGCWVDLLRTLSLDDLRKQFFHPEQNKKIRLADTARIYAYHTDHHIGQILWLRSAHTW